MPADHREAHWTGVRERYAALARAAATRGDAVFGAGLYRADELGELPPGARVASWGCGNPLAVADPHPGEVVLDLGSGGGLDVILSARRVGPGGLAFGLDMTEEMLALARRAAAGAGAGNAVFLRGRIEDIPLPAESVDVVISNCVLCLSPDKQAVFAEIARVLRAGGRLGITDLVAHEGTTEPATPPAATRDETLAGAWARDALTAGGYREMLTRAGLPGAEVRLTHPAGGGLHAATVRAAKPARAAQAPGHASGNASPAGPARTGTPGPAAENAARQPAGVRDDHRAGVRVEPMRVGHWLDVAAIYQAGIDTGNATFEGAVPEWGDWHRGHLADARLVALREGRVAGWAALSPVSGRCVYAGVAEVSVYVSAQARGAGVGRALLEALVRESERAGIWTLQAGIFPENAASLALHRAAGFRVVGRRERIGQHHGRWRDVLLLERRSAATG